MDSTPASMKRTFRCSACSTELKSARNFDIHCRLKCHPQIPAETSDNYDEEENQNRSSTDQQTEESPLQIFECSLCLKQFKCESKLDKHLRVKHEFAVRNKRTLLRCFSCNKVVTTRQGMIYHIKTCHSENITKEFVDTRLECYTCGKRYRYKRGLIEHMRAQHPHQIARKGVYEGFRSHACVICERKYTFRRGLLEHIRIFHPETIVRKNKNFECELCHKKYSYVRGLNEHIKKQHIIKEFCNSFLNNEFRDEKFDSSYSFSKNMKQQPTMGNLDVDSNSAISMKDNVDGSLSRINDDSTKWHSSTVDIKNYQSKVLKCEICFKKYTSQKAFLRHVRLKHSEELMTCAICSRSFMSRVKLTCHLEKKHRPLSQEKLSERGIKKQAIHVCPLCMTSYRKKASLISHLAEQHNINLQYESLECDDKSAFDEWKRKMELNTRSRYVLYNRYETDREKVTHYVCHRSGIFCTRSKGIRNIRRIGSKKMNGFCPAEIRLRVRGRVRECLVDFCGTHVGHDTAQLRELRYLKRPECEQDEIANTLSTIASPKILDTNPLVGHFVICSLNDDITYLSPVIPAADEILADDVNDSMLPNEIKIVEDMHTIQWTRENAEFVFYYKGRNVSDAAYPELSESDFVLIIADDSQLRILKTFGSNIVAIDRSETSPSRDFELLTLSVYDELYLEFVCVYMFTNCRDEIVYRLLFEKLYEQIGALETRVLITDATNACVNAWQTVMPPPQRHLYCDWHVRQDWNRNLLRIVSLYKRYETRTFLHSLKDELNLLRFHQLMDAWINEPEDDLRDFKCYFDETYAKCSSCWAHCYRKHAGVNVSMAAERFLAVAHKSLAENEFTLLLGQALNSLSEAIRNFYAEKIKIETQAKLVPKIKYLRDGHSIAMKNQDMMRCINRLTSTQWYVPTLDRINEDESIVHHVEMVKFTCDCDLLCELCEICLHMFTCTCAENCIEFNMCEHIHLVCLFRKENKLNDEKDDLTPQIQDVNLIEEVEDDSKTCSEDSQLRTALTELVNDSH